MDQSGLDHRERKKPKIFTLLRFWTDPESNPSLFSTVFLNTRAFNVYGSCRTGINELLRTAINVQYSLIVFTVEIIVLFVGTLVRPRPNVRSAGTIGDQLVGTVIPIGQWQFGGFHFLFGGNHH